MIGYECFVGLITAKGDIYLREAGNNCERGQEPLKYGMRLSQVSKCYGLHHKSRFWTTTAKPRRKVTALPHWRRNAIEGAGGASAAAASLILILSAALISLC